jgi:hypothetical protein
VAEIKAIAAPVASEQGSALKLMKNLFSVVGVG